MRKKLLSEIDPSELTLTDKLITINRVAKVVKGGKRLRFNALVVAGSGRGHVGVGLAKAQEVPTAIAKAGSVARRHLIQVAMKDTTIPYQSEVKYGTTRVLLKPAVRGSGIIAGGTVRAVVEAAGIKDIVAKTLGSRNRINVAKATVLALAQLKNPEEYLARRRGTTPSAAAAARPEKVNSEQA